MTQPTPDVTAADVERVVRRDFPAEVVEEVFAVLDQYGSEDWHPEIDRVRLAALKLAVGSVEHLRRHIEIAKSDYRDALSAAEYPGYSKRWFHIDELTADERQSIIDADWKQYQDWLTRG
jgi:hypothetical protein